MREGKNFYVLLDLIKYGLDFNKYYCENHYKYLDLNEVDWGNVFDKANNHKVTAISYEGLLNLYSVEEFTLNKKLLGKWDMKFLKK